MVMCWQCQQTYPSDNINTSLEEFRAVHGQIPDLDSLKFPATHKIDPTKRMLVIFCGPSMVKVNSVCGIIGDITNRQSLAGLILILQSHITSQAMKSLESLTFKVEIFKIAELTSQSMF